MNKLKSIFYIIVVFLFFWWGRDFFPTSREVTEIQATQVLGIDLENDGKVTMSIAVENKKSEDSSNGSDMSQKKEKVVSTTADTFSSCIEGLQNYSDKIFIGGHIRNVVIGENMARNSLVRAIDFLTKDKEVRFNINMFIAKESTAKDLMTESLSADYELTDKLSNLVLTSKGNRAEEHTELIDVMNILISDEKNGVIPAAKVVKDNEYSREFSMSVSDDNKARDQFDGYAIIKDGNLIDFLDINSATGYDYINNKITKMAVNITRGDEIIGLDINDFRTSINFNFDDKVLKEIKIKANVKNTIAESSLGHNVFKENLTEVENLVGDKIKSQILLTVNKAKSEGVDFIGIDKVLEMKHPYKWRNIKENWGEIFVNVPITVDVESKINRTYDILGIIKSEKH